MAMSITVSVVQTGTIRIRPSHRSQSATRPVWLRRLRVLADRHWTEPLPINTYLIDHPEGYLLFDSGESPRAVQSRYFPVWQPFSTSPSTSTSPPTRVSAPGSLLAASTRPVTSRPSSSPTCTTTMAAGFRT